MEIHHYKGTGIGYPVGSYVNDAIRVAKDAAKVFRDICPNKDRPVNVWCRGSSGTILATLFASNIKGDVTISHVKKPGEQSHIIGPYYQCNGINIIIDDFIATGDTVKSIYQKMTVFGIYQVYALIICGQAGTDESYFRGCFGFSPLHIITNCL
jgi:hypothetical protein